VTGDLAVVVEDGRLRVRRGDSTAVVLPHEVRRLVDALVEGGERFGGQANAREVGRQSELVSTCGDR
jgi:hypothetical protein